MTTTCGIIYKDGVVLASEQRVTIGDFIACRTAQKIYKISSSVGFTFAGGVGHALELIRILKYEAAIFAYRRGVPMRVSAVNALLSNFLIQNRANPYEVDPTIGGFDDTGPRLFTMDLMGGSSEEAAFTSTGSGSSAALGVLEDDYAKDLTEREAINLAKRAIATAKKRDTGSGEATACVIIDAGGYRDAELDN